VEVKVSYGEPVLMVCYGNMYGNSLYSVPQLFSYLANNIYRRVTHMYLSIQDSQLVVNHRSGGANIAIIYRILAQISGGLLSSGRGLLHSQKDKSLGSDKFRFEAISELRQRKDLRHRDQKKVHQQLFRRWAWRGQTGKREHQWQR
jgi:hypothetical protein